MPGRKKGWTGWPALYNHETVGGARSTSWSPAFAGATIQTREAVEGCSVAPEGHWQGSIHGSEIDREEVDREEVDRKAEEPHEGQTDPDQDPRHSRQSLDARALHPPTVVVPVRRAPIPSRCPRGTSRRSGSRWRCRPARCRPRATSAGPCRSRPRPVRRSRCPSSRRPACCWPSRTPSGRGAAGSSST